MNCKADWPEARRRLTALWHRERLDRPCIVVTAPQPVAAPTHVPVPADDQARWLDPVYQVAAHMGTQEFLMALVDHPAWMATALLLGAQDELQARRDLQGMVRARHDYWYGNAGWMPFWAPEPFTSTQSDASCMLSPEIFDRFIVPELEVHGQEHGALWYHLDGGDARQHLPRLLSLSYLRVIQYVPAPCEPPNGPGHLGMYRQIQAAGKIVHVHVPCQHVEPLVRELDPALLMLDTRCTSREEGEKLLEQSVAWARGAASPLSVLQFRDACVGVCRAGPRAGATAATAGAWRRRCGQR